ncbi:MAG TPA: phosphotransferase [Stellaceae bacterium]|jgi:aminoglycoside phosphotransferase (APT) family kinase protein|nr:phosphotransferase [Stellaceae bacterium]
MSDRTDSLGQATGAVRAAHRFDEGRLADWLAANIAGFRGPLTIEQFQGGQSNPTYRLTTPGRQYVLRRKPPGRLLPSAHAVDREYRIITALRTSEVPVPRTYGLCNDEGVIGTAFYVMDFVAGRIFWDPLLPDMVPAERRAIYDELNRVIAALHRAPYAALGLADYGRPGNYFVRQIDRWTKQYRASETEEIAAMDRLMAWLPAHVPADDETAIVHGDYRLDNVIFHAREPRILAVLDWELSTLGNPLGDFAYHMMQWRLGSAIYQRGLADADFAAMGIPDEAQYRALYCQRTGRDGIPHWDFYMVYNMFRLAAILQGIMGRVVEGNASSASAREQGARARLLAEAGWRLVEQSGAA